MCVYPSSQLFPLGVETVFQKMANLERQSDFLSLTAGELNQGVFV